MTSEERADLLEDLRQHMLAPRACPILQALHIGSAVFAMGALQDDLDAIARSLSEEPKLT